MAQKIEWSKSFNQVVESKCGRFQIYSVTPIKELPGKFEVLDTHSGQVVRGDNQKNLKCEAHTMMMETA